MDIAGRVDLVTGGASGIGRAVVEVLLQKQAKGVFILDIDDDGLKKTQEEFHEKYGDDKVHCCKCDVSYEQMEECFKKVISTYGALHIVCNNAGILNEVTWERMLQINLNGVINGTKLAVHYMGGESCGGGVVINTASRDGLVLPPFKPVYATSKCAIIGFTRQVATYDPQVVKKKIRVNIICPGRVETPLMSNIVVEKQYQEAFARISANSGSAQKSNAKTTAQELAAYFVKLIEEPHHGQTMFVADGQNYTFVQDENQAYRQQAGLEEIYKKRIECAFKE